jgi:EAL domain-containing protein (putative c-di-GMP-specific phosphodiesterase class I)
MSTSANEVQRLLLQQDIRIVFQPIVNTTLGAELGFEALARGPEGSPLQDAYTLFTAAADAGLLLPLEMLCRELAIRRFVALQLPGKLFLNVSPMALLDRQHHSGQTLRLLEQYGLDSRRVVIELSERYPMHDTDLLLLATRHYASMGLQIAIDDLGAGYSGLKLWSELTPDYVKIDRHFVAGVHADRIKREFVRFIRDISARIGCQVIAEGVETADEYEALTGLGIRHLQGYFLGRPASQPEPQEAARFQPSRRRQLLALNPLYA